MKKLIALGLTVALVVLLAFQTTQQPILSTTITGITSSWAGECAAGVIDNSSAVSRQNKNHLLWATGTGTWSAALTYSNTSCSSGFSAYLSTATITQASGVPIAWAVDPLSVPARYIKITLSGTVSVTYVGSRVPISAGGTSGVGTVGPSGPSGPSGPRGASGPSGPTGATGSTGSTGASGPSGPRGATGPTGATGSNGSNGAAGVSGPSGPTGVTGASGPSGPSGVSGPSGPSGPVYTLSTSYKIRPCYIAIGTLTGSALANGDDRPVQCGNAYGATLTITSVSCYADAGSPTVTPIITGSGATSILTGALTCGTASFASGTLNGTPLLTNGSTIDGNITVAGGTAKFILIQVTGTLP